MTTIRDLASVVRSKNAGPFTLTFDLFFEERADYERVRDSGAIERDTIADLYGIDPEDVRGIHAIDRIEAIKVSIRRPVASGAVADTDVYGAQQHAPLFDLEV